MRETTLSNGVKMPFIGLGAFKLTDPKEAYNAIRSALDLGYRHIDTAMIYHNEEIVGKAIKESEVNREDIFVTTKVWPDDIRKNNVKQAFELSLKKLQLDYVDLYLVHWPVKDHYISVWSEMEKIYKAEMARAIGVSNYEIHFLEDLLEVCEQPPMVNQFEIHPYLSQQELINYCMKNNVQPEAYSPLGAGKSDLLENPLLVDLANKYSKTTAQIVIRWNIERGVVVIPKSVSRERQAENFNVFDFSLSAEEVSKITAMNKNIRVAFDPDTFPF